MKNIIDKIFKEEDFAQESIEMIEFELFLFYSIERDQKYQIGINCVWFDIKNLLLVWNARV